MTRPGARQRNTDWRQDPAGLGRALEIARRSPRPRRRKSPLGEARGPWPRWGERQPVSEEGSLPPPRPVPGARDWLGRAETERSAWIDGRRTLGGDLKSFTTVRQTGSTLLEAKEPRYF